MADRLNQNLHAISIATEKSGQKSGWIFGQGNTTYKPTGYLQRFIWRRRLSSYCGAR